MNLFFMHTTQKPKLVPSNVILNKGLFLRLKMHYVFTLSLFSYVHAEFLGVKHARDCAESTTLFRIMGGRQSKRDSRMI
jgi:hypothetical protein